MPLEHDAKRLPERSVSGLEKVAPIPKASGGLGDSPRQCRPPTWKLHAAYKRRTTTHELTAAAYSTPWCRASPPCQPTLVHERFRRPS
jgi:hypothetical protein